MERTFITQPRNPSPIIILHKCIELSIVAKDGWRAFERISGIVEPLRSRLSEVELNNERPELRMFKKSLPRNSRDPKSSSSQRA